MFILSYSVVFIYLVHVLNSLWIFIWESLVDSLMLELGGGGVCYYVGGNQRTLRKPTSVSGWPPYPLCLSISGIDLSSQWSEAREQLCSISVYILTIISCFFVLHIITYVRLTLLMRDGPMRVNLPMSDSHVRSKALHLWLWHHKFPTIYITNSTVT
jgi:hypothetical protein